MLDAKPYTSIYKLVALRLSRREVQAEQDTWY